MLRALNGPPNNDFGPLGVIGQTWKVQWVPINDPEATTSSCVQQGIARAAPDSAPRRLLVGKHEGVLPSTNGGPVSEGQVFEYDPFIEALKLIYASPTANDLDNPDNITVTPRGGLLLCEDAAGGVNVAAERMVGLTLDGNTFTFARTTSSSPRT